MQETINSQNKSKSIHLDTDFNLDEFDFKPINKGLGFHQEKKMERPQNNSTYKKRTQPRAQADISRREVSLNLHQKTLGPSSLLKEKKVVNKKVKKEVIPAKMGVQVTAFVFDMFILLAAQLILNAVFVNVARLDSIETFFKLTWIEQGIFFSFVYLFYFTIFDLVGSPGKRVFSLHINSTSSRQVSIDQTFVRAFVSLLSFFTLWMPMLFDFQGKLSDTSVVEDA